MKYLPLLPSHGGGEVWLVSTGLDSTMALSMVRHAQRCREERPGASSVHHLNPFPVTIGTPGHHAQCWVSTSWLSPEQDLALFCSALSLCCRGPSEITPGKPPGRSPRAPLASSANHTQVPYWAVGCTRRINLHILPRPLSFIIQCPSIRKPPAQYSDTQVCILCHAWLAVSLGTLMAV